MSKLYTSAELCRECGVKNSDLTYQVATGKCPGGTIHGRTRFYTETERVKIITFFRDRTLTRKATLETKIAQLQKQLVATK